MFDFDAGKFLIIGIVALIVIGPKELPRVLRQVGQMVGRVRRMAAEFQGQFMDAMKEADIESIRQDLKKIGDEAELSVQFDPARDIQRELTNSLGEARAAEAVPALAEGLQPATARFALPSPEASPSEPETEAPAPIEAGVAPAVPLAVEPPADEAPALNGAAGLSRAAKRKIIVRKRSAVAVSRPHAVCDRTRNVRGRASRARGLEAAER